MSSFCVFGVTVTQAKARARKQATRDATNRAKNGLPALSVAEYDELVEKLTAEIFESAKPSKCSPLYDAPQFAHSFIEVGGRTGALRGGRVMELKRSGVTKAGKPKRVWSEFKAA